MKTDFDVTFVDLSDVPIYSNLYGLAVWVERFNQLPEGKAGMLRFNNRLRANQVMQSIRSAARYHKIPISTRIIHAEPAIHDTDGWLLYFWKRLEPTT